jgi:glycosyltransferase involved in cell wall biosynthesis
MKNNLNNKKIAIVCDWIKDMWWAELVLLHIIECFPNADIFTSVFFQKDNKIFKWKKITTSFIQKIPLLNKSHKLALNLRPLAFESFDLSDYDIVISSSSAESKWVITKPDTLHICYCHTPTRYFWSHFHEYMNYMEFWIFNFFWKKIAPKIISKLRIWDYIAAQRPDYFIWNSKNTINRIKKYYNRDADIIYPGINIWEFTFSSNKDDYYLYVWRCIPYKKFDLIVNTFNQNNKKLIIVTNTKNKLQAKLQSISNNNITWKIWIERKELIDLYSKTRAFLFPADEDFWIVPLEAMVSWTPVIAFKKWWVLETVIEGQTWIFFNEQNTKSLNIAIEKFENTIFNHDIVRNHALNFSSDLFKQKLINFIENKYYKLNK